MLKPPVELVSKQIPLNLALPTLGSCPNVASGRWQVAVSFQMEREPVFQQEQASHVKNKCSAYHTHT